MKFFFAFLFILIIAGAGLYWYYLQSPYSKGIKRTLFGQAESMTLKSDAFLNGAQIPTKYTCDGADINPAFSFSAIPIDTKSLAIVVEDKDSKPSGFTHWLIFNIRPTLNGIDEDSVPQDAVQGINDFAHTYYEGPCPDSGKHNYVFKLYALNTFLDLHKGVTKQDFQKEIGNHVLDEAELTGFYQK